MRINLNCPFSDKDQAKALGARWDAVKRVWYIVDPDDLQPFARWLNGRNTPKPHKHKKTAHGPRQAPKQCFVTIGMGYVDDPTIQCIPPWEDKDPPDLIRMLRSII